MNSEDLQTFINKMSYPTGLATRQKMEETPEMLQEAREVIDNIILEDKTNYPYIREVGLWPYVERKRRIDNLITEIEERTGERISCLEDLEDRVKHLEEWADSRYSGHFSDKLNVYRKYLEQWRKAERIENEDAVLEGARKILEEKRDYCKALAVFYEYAWRDILYELKLLSDSGRADFRETVELYDGGNPSLKGINQLIKAYKKVINAAPSWAVLPKRQQRMDIYKRVLRHLERIREIRKQEFPLCQDLMDVVDWLELMKTKPENGFEGVIAQ